MKNIGLTIAALMVSIVVFGQTSVDALRFSQRYYSGSARSMAMGNSIGAVGADMSTMFTNPAGIGLFRSSTVEISPLINNTLIQSTHYGETHKDDKLNVNIGNVGIVWAIPVSGSDFKYFQFGMGFNRLNDFNNNLLIKGDNPNSSFVNDLQNEAFNVMPGSLNLLSTNLAWQSYLFSDTTRTPGGDLWYHSFFQDGGVDQERTIRTRGGMNEFAMNFGTSFQDKLYLGATMAYTYFRYEEESEMSEIDEADSIPQLSSAEYNYSINSNGGAMTFKLGFIYRPNSWMRIGGAYHSPTRFAITEDYRAQIVANYDNGANFTGGSADTSSTGFRYNITSPMRLIADVAFTVAKKVIISGEYEYVDYSEINMRYNGGYSAADVNNEIMRKYTSTHNLRGGVEVNMQPVRFRAGVAHYGSPFADDINDGSMWQYSGGIGIRNAGYFVEFAYVYSQKAEDYYIYNSQLVNPTALDLTSHQFVATLGFKF